MVREKRMGLNWVYEDEDALHFIPICQNYNESRKNQPNQIEMMLLTISIPQGEAFVVALCYFHSGFAVM